MTGTISVTMLPARDGDCLFVEACDFRLLIDGGRSQTGKAVLPAFLATLPPRLGKPTVDLIVLSHVDADHIAGLLTFLAKPASVTIGEVWFNGLDHHKKAADLFVPPRASNAGVGKTGLGGTLNVAQALNFHQLVQALSIPWNEKSKGEAVMVTAEEPLPRIELASGLVLVLLGPPKQKLADFYPEWDAAVRGLDKAPTLAARPKFIPTVDNLEKLAEQENTPDRTKPNGASIAFILEVGDTLDKKRVLFAADSHPDDVIGGLKRYSKDERVFFHAIKVSHHGSAKNNTSSLVDKLTSPYWLISTDGSRHGHPDSEAIARIVLSSPDTKTLVFNYRSAINRHWEATRLQTDFAYKTCYGDGKSPVTITV
ncbi:MBL fold metallo-hydrolase [Rhizobium rhizogenes]|uniref:MBL fold metallo-hydrolase n=1 Tax=Rhizobium rhizogenes TaxID=359 RepID=UPI00193C8D7A|nr:MBL fold metallo-hydrolase [Rhizobium rhizogenes]QRM40497.1 MBL fold metallo-hydrolase [Rhizobium rhizogenes]